MHKPTHLIIVTLAFLALFTLLVSAAESRLISGWVRVAPLPQSIVYSRAVAYGNTIYVVGGEVPDWATPVASVFQAQVETDGSIVQWATPVATLAITLPLPLNRHAMVQASWGVTASLYVIGGFSNGNRYAEVWRADRVASTSQLRGWIEMRNYPRKIILHEAVYANSHIYVLGGWGEDEHPLKDVYSTKVNSNGELEAWQMEQELPKPLYHFSSAYYSINCKNYLYVTGGYDGAQFRRNVYVTEIDPEGRLKKWKDVEALPRGLAYHQTIVNGNHLVVMGGSGSDGSYNEVYSALIKTDGTLDRWVTETDLPDSISSFATALVKFPNRQSIALYVLGGQNGGDRRSQVYYAAPLPASVVPDIQNPNFMYLPFIQGC